MHEFKDVLYLYLLIRIFAFAEKNELPSMKR